ncbi:MAG: LLM class flavin-dependent oxidoreductase [Solirubrobacterales bacterium]
MKVGIYMDLRNPAAWERPWNRHYARVLERIELAESLGIDSVWLTEHHLFEDGYLPQPLTFAAAIAARTRRIRIGTAILIAPLRKPIEIAEQAAMVDILSDGRLELGLGAGYLAQEFAAFGVDIGRRFPLLEESAASIRQIWAESGVTPKPIQDPAPLWVGALGPRGARIAGRLGEGLLSLDPELLAPYLGALEKAGFERSRARMTGLTNMIVSHDPERTWALMSPHLGYQWNSYLRAASAGTSAERMQDGVGVDAIYEFDAADQGVDPETLRSEGPVMLPPAIDVVTPEDAVGRLTSWVSGLPAETGFFWDSIGAMPDELVHEHLTLLATRVAPAVSELGAPA